MQPFTYKVYPADKSLAKQWFVEYYNPNGGRNLKKYVSVKLNSLEEREAALIDILQTIQQEWKTEAGAVVTGYKLLNDLDKVLQYRMSGLRKKTQSGYSCYFTSFKNFYVRRGRNLPFEQLGLEYVIYLKSKGLKNKTINNHKKSFNSFFKDLKTYFSDRYGTNPFEPIRALPEDSVTKSYFTVRQVQQIKDMLVEYEPQLWVACQIMYYCFLRPNEIRELRVGNIDFERKQFQLSGSQTKNRSNNTVPIPDVLLQQLQYVRSKPKDYFVMGINGYPSSVMLGRDQLSKLHKKYLTKLGIKGNFSFYSWKNTGALQLVRNGTHIKVISMLMRHSSIEITDLYLKSLGIDDLLQQSMIKYTTI